MIIHGGGYNYYVPTLMQSAMFLVTFVCYNLWTFGFVSMVNQRLHTETKESKERFELIFNTSPDAAILSMLEDGRIVDVNDGFSALTGFKREDVVGKLSTEVNLWKNVENRQTFAKELSENGCCENMESYFRRKDGSEVLGIVSAKITSLHGVPHVISITRDISARRLAENALRKSEALYRSILAASPDGIVITELDGPIRMASPKVLEIFGYEKEEDVLGCRFLQFVVPEERERAQTKIGLMFQGIFSGPAEYRGLGANGKIIDIEANAEFVRDVDGAPSNFVIIIREISERKRFTAAQQHNAVVQKVLKEITEATLLSTSLDELYEKVHQWVGLVLPAKNFYIALLEKDSEEIDFPYCVDETQTLPRRRPVGKGLTEYVLHQGKAVHVNLEEFNELCDAGIIELRYGNIKQEWLGAPLTDAKGKAFGAIALNLIHEDYSIGQMDIEVLSIIASQISMAIVRKNMEEELKRQATMDELTGIMNRRYFLTRAGEELKRIQRYDGSCAMLIMDVDNFKQVNDTYGHAAGDAVLKRVASICATVLRDTDLLGRIGGEEFAILLLEGGDEAYMQVAERLRQNVAKDCFIVDTDVQVPLSISVGVAGSLSQNESIPAMMKRADKALYQAKNAGKNRVVVY